MSGGGAGPGVVARWGGLARRRWRLGLGVFLAVAGAAALVLLLSRPVYRAEARLRLSDPPPSGGVTPSAGALSLFRPGGDPFANDLELLSSRTLTERVVRDAALSVQLDAPRGWYRDSIFVSLAVGDSTAEATFELAWTGDGSVRIRRTAPRDSLVGTARVGEPVRFGGVHAVVRERRPDGPATVRVTTLPLDEAVRETAGRLDVERTRREANVLELRFAHADPGVADAVVSSAVRNFVLMRTTIFQRESGETVDSLRTVARTTEEELLQAEEALAATQRSTGLVAIDAQAEVLIERHAAARALQEELRVELALLEAQMERVAAAGDPVEAWTALVAAPAFLANQTVGDLLTRLTALAEERTELASRRTAESRQFRTLEARLAQLDGALRSLAGEYRQGLARRAEEASREVADLEARLARVPGQVIELGRRQRAVRVLSELLVLTEQRLRQEELREALSFSTVQVIDPPAVRWRPVWPRKRLGAVVGLLLGLGAAGLALVLVEAADGRVRTAAELEEVTGLEVLGLVHLEGAAESAAPLGAALPADVALLAVPGGAAPRFARALGLDPAAAAPGVVDGPAAAAALARAGRPVVLAVELGAADGAALRRAARWLAGAGVTVAGAVGGVSRAGDVASAWG